MPHQCTNCTRVFDDGSKEMLSGCPDCGGNKFQFKPDGVDETPDAEPPEPPEPPEPAGSSSVAKTVGKTAATVRDIVGGGSSSEPTVGAEGAERTDPLGDAPTTREDTAQASARSEIVRPDELPSGADADSATEHRFQPVRTESTDAAPSTGTDDPGVQAEDAGATADAPESSTQERPDLDELRAELNDQFESIKVLNPGQYELNLMELYDREEYIVALQEDGRYSIQVPENFREA